MSASAASTSEKDVLAGIIGYYDGPKEILQAMPMIRDAKYENFDAFTPFPVHGLEHAQGVKRSPIPYVTFIAGLTGGCLAFLLEYWTSAVDWPLIVGGKPFNSWPAFIPVTFELTVLFAGLSTAGAMFAFNGLPNVKRRSYDPALTNDKFAIVIEAPTPVEEDDEVAMKWSGKFKKFDLNEATELLKKSGAKDVRPVYAEGWF